ncbi:MBL fold metallo-hydrolase [Streptomyces sp. NPDC097619]|uniref:MBL fold metallo-hydrolase n=1 Tax=Streptomyces sp. NPDC097619 TaxID=3157228 RepID=UPI0033229F53
MRVHHLNCGSLRTIPLLGAGAGAGAGAGRAEAGPAPELPAVCHCLLIETPSDGLVLVDTGIGTDDVRRDGRTLGADWLAHARPALDPEESALRQIRRLGHDPRDVRHVLLTHLHRDHTGGLPDFPHATVHAHPAELSAAGDPSAPHHARTLASFMPAHRAHGPRLTPARTEPGTTWFGFTDLARPEGLAADGLLFVPLPGHSAGHSGVAVRRADGRWLLHAGDAYMYHGELAATPPLPHPVLDPVQQGAQVAPDARLDTLGRLRALYREHAGEVDVFSAHDPWEFARPR